MKKRIAALILAVMTVVAMVGCDSKCKANNCDEKAYKDGYCEIHYAAKQLTDGLKDLFK